MKQRLRVKQRSRLLAALATSAVTAFSMVVAVGVTTPAQAASDITFDGSPGTSAPPSTLGPYLMGRFGTDTQPTGNNVTGVTGPTGTVGFSPPLSHLTAPSDSSWSTWSNDYKGDVYSTSPGTDAATEKLTLPSGTQAFYFYAEPWSWSTITITATAQDGTSSGAVSVNGKGGAHYFGFYSTFGTTLPSTITVSSPQRFAIGEFGIAGMAPVLHNIQWSGYMATGSQPYTGVTAVWNAPKSCGLSLPSTVTSWIGLGGGPEISTLPQIGITTECTSTHGSTLPLGQQDYAWWAVIAKPGDQAVPISTTDYPVQSGSNVEAQITLTSGAVNGTPAYYVNFKIDSYSNHWKAPFTKTVQINKTEFAAAQTSAEWIVEAPIYGSIYPRLPDYGAITFDGATYQMGGKKWDSLGYDPLLTPLYIDQHPATWPAGCSILQTGCNLNYNTGPGSHNSIPGPLRHNDAFTVSSS